MPRRRGLDTIDATLITALQANGRASYEALACLVELTSVGVAKRVQRYLGGDPILAIRAMVSPDALRPAFCAFVDLAFEPFAHPDAVEAKLNRLPDVAGAWSLWDAGITRVLLATDAPGPIEAMLMHLGKAGLIARVCAVALVRDDIVTARGPQITALDLKRSISERRRNQFETNAA